MNEISAHKVNVKMLLAVALFLIVTHDVSSELRKLIPTCPTNSCFNPVGAHRTKYCYCDSKCSLVYNDCCLDAPYRVVRVTIRRHPDLDCIFVHGENSHFLMVGVCKETWSGNQRIRDKCETPAAVTADTSDVIGSVPVTNPVDEKTYKNYYCALCNDENLQDLIEWRLKALCSSRSVTDSDVMRNLTYVDEKSQWGVWKRASSSSDWSFHECLLLFQRPAFAKGIRQCAPGMVSTCPPTWKDMSVRRKCKSYVDPVRWPRGLVYKNMDCAACHNVTENNFHCLYDVARGSNEAMLGLATSVDLDVIGEWLLSHIGINVPKLAYLTESIL